MGTNLRRPEVSFAQVHFEQCDASENLRFDDNTFDAIFSNDVLCHLPGRLTVLREMFRILKPSKRMLFSDALVVGGMLPTKKSPPGAPLGFTCTVPREKTNG